MNSLTYKDVNVTVTDAGIFTAVVKGIEVSGKTYEELKMKIDAEFKGTMRSVRLAVVGVGATGYKKPAKVVNDVIVGINRTTSNFRFETNSEISMVLPASPENAALLTEFLEARFRYEKISAEVDERRIYYNGGGRLDASKYEIQLQNLERAYKAATRKSNINAEEPVTV